MGEKKKSLAQRARGGMEISQASAIIYPIYSLEVAIYFSHPIKSLGQDEKSNTLTLYYIHFTYIRF